MNNQSVSSGWFTSKDASKDVIDEDTYTYSPKNEEQKKLNQTKKIEFADELEVFA